MHFKVLFGLLGTLLLDLSIIFKSLYSKIENCSPIQVQVLVLDMCFNFISWDI